MNAARSFTILAAALALAFGALGMPQAQERAGAPWLEDYKQALAAAREHDRPIFLVFRCVP